MLKSKREYKKFKNFFVKAIVKNTKRVSGEPHALTGSGINQEKANLVKEFSKANIHNHPHNKQQEQQWHQQQEQTSFKRDQNGSNNREELPASKAVSTKAKNKLTGRFGNLRTSIIDRLEKIEAMQNEQFKPKTSVVSGNSPKEVIAYRERMRHELSLITEEWNTLNKLYVNELNKRKSRLSPSDLQIQNMQLLQIKEYISNMNDAKINGFTSMVSIDIERTKTNVSDTVIPRAITHYNAEASNKNAAGSDPIPLTEMDEFELRMIEEKDQAMDDKLDTIGDLVSGLRSIANAKEEELRRQNKLLDDIDRKGSEAYDRVHHNNKKVADSLRRK